MHTKNRTLVMALVHKMAGRLPLFSCDLIATNISAPPASKYFSSPGQTLQEKEEDQSLQCDEQISSL